MSLKRLLPFLPALLLAPSTKAQEHMHHGMAMLMDSTHAPSTMTHAYSLSAPMNRNGSGTAWAPDSTPMFGYMHHAGAWMWMAHGNVFLRYVDANAGHPDRRGAAGVDAPNWAMGMAQRRVGERGLLAFTAMLSLDPLTIGGGGYPLLFQTGESWEGRPLVDRQHPHDLLSALSVGYTHRFTPDLELTGYAGYPGEPALGPVAFMHRVTALSDPDAPLAHHWQDATHITFGVGTLGLRYRRVKVEASVFNGREPDEDRYGWDRARLDSRSARVSVAPSGHWALQASTAWLASPEGPGSADVRRTTASAAYASATHGTSWNGIVAWGLNDSGQDHREHSVLLELARITDKGNTYLRHEWVQKSAHELQLDLASHDGIANVNSLTLGHAQRIAHALRTDLFLGAQGGIAFPSAALEPFYGDRPLSFSVYLRLTPARMAP